MIKGRITAIHSVEREAQRSQKPCHCWVSSGQRSACAQGVSPEGGPGQTLETLCPHAISLLIYCAKEFEHLFSIHLFLLLGN